MAKTDRQVTRACRGVSKKAKRAAKRRGDVEMIDKMLAHVDLEVADGAHADDFDGNEILDDAEAVDERGRSGSG